MKAKIAVVLALALLGIVALLECRNSLSIKERLAIAYSYGRFQGYLTSSNYPAAYSMMSARFREVNTLPLFESRLGSGLSLIFLSCPWNETARIAVQDSQASLSIKYNVSFGSTFYLVKENGGWCLTDRFSTFEAF